MDLQNRLKDFIKTKKRTISSVAKAVDVSTATLHLWMNNKYEGNIKKVNDAVARFLEIEELREGRVSLDFVKTTVADDVFDIYVKPSGMSNTDYGEFVRAFSKLADRYFNDGDDPVYEYGEGKKH